MRKALFRNLATLLAPALILFSGCGGYITAHPSNSVFSISPATASIDTNCTGCNAVNARGKAILQWSASLSGGGAADVTWTVTGGDRTSGPGVITAGGQYTPPSYLTSDRAAVLITASLNSDPTQAATSVLTLTPGFLQPLTPENAALGANGSVTLTGVLAVAGGNTAIDFSLAHMATGNPEPPNSGLGTLSAPTCQHSTQAFTTCSVTYTAPTAVSATTSAYVIATVANEDSPSARVAAPVLLNTAGVTSNPAAHQLHFPANVPLGSSGGNNSDYDLQGKHVQDCCGGTLGALLQDQTGRNYLLGNNHVLARSDHATVGDAIIQPGLIDNNCSPSGSNIAPVATLTHWLPLSAKSTNADAALAMVTSRAVDNSGSILELGARQPDGTLAAAPPGVSSTNGKGESASLSMRVAKSGRTSGLTCGNITAVDLDVTVDYFEDCAESRPFLSKTFTHQLGVSGNAFSDAGDSGALLIDPANAEPVALFFAGGLDAAGVSQGVATPSAEVLSELSALPGGQAYSFVGTTDHPVSCLSYGDATLASAQSHSLDAIENARLKAALVEARSLVNPSAGILGVAPAKSIDRPGEAALLLYIDESANPTVPATLAGVRTIPITTSAFSVAFGVAPHASAQSASVALSATALSQAIAVKEQIAHEWMKLNPAFFAVGVGQSLDHPREAALVVYVDRKRIPATLPATYHGLRVRYLFMDRLHVTRSYALPNAAAPHCLPHAAQNQPGSFDPLKLIQPFFRP